MNDHAYFRAIEDHFIRLRGAPLLLSPADWQIAREWHREGIPLDLVLGALDEVFERRAERGSERPIQSLRYCSSAVAAAWKRSFSMSQAGHRKGPPPIDLADRLAALAAAVPPELAGAAELRASIVALGRGGEAAERVEAGLADLDRNLLRAARGSLNDDRRAAVELGVERGIEALGGRLTPDEAESTRQRLREQVLRRELNLPVLSLFSDV